MDLRVSLDHITRTHHALLRAELPVLDRLLADAPQGLAVSWRQLSTLLQEHMAKEEHAIFPLIRSIELGGDSAGSLLTAAMRSMSFEHARVTALEQAVRARLEEAGPHRERLEAVLDDLQMHATLEEEVVFPAALARAEELGLA